MSNTVTLSTCDRGVNGIPCCCTCHFLCRLRWIEAAALAGHSFESNTYYYMYKHTQRRPETLMLTMLHYHWDNRPLPSNASNVWLWLDTRSPDPELRNPSELHIAQLFFLVNDMISMITECLRIGGISSVLGGLWAQVGLFSFNVLCITWDLRYGRGRKGWGNVLMSGAVSLCCVHVCAERGKRLSIYRMYFMIERPPWYEIIER